MSYTPRTDLMVERAPIGLRTNSAFEQSCDLCRTLERELNAANERIKRLEEAGDSLKAAGYFGGFGDAVNKWNKAKEAKP
jgi:hypothetical protein